MKIAAVNWKLREIAKEKEFYSHLRELLDQCNGCDLVVLPELFGFELCALKPDIPERELPEYLSHFFEPIRTEMQKWLATQPSCVLVGGTNVANVKLQSTRSLMNRCPILFGDWVVPQDKNVLTEWEKQVGIERGFGLSYLTEQRLGVAICLDAEFPAAARALTEQGAHFLAVPAWTETMHGFHRVRSACRARSVECQVVSVHSALVGRVGKESCVGSSAVVAPPHPPFPFDPVLAETPMDQEGVAIAEIDPEDVLKCREQGEVRNWRDRDAGDWTVRTV